MTLGNYFFHDETRLLLRVTISNKIYPGIICANLKIHPIIIMTGIWWICLHFGSGLLRHKTSGRKPWASVVLVWWPQVKQSQRYPTKPPVRSFCWSLVAETRGAPQKARTARYISWWSTARLARSRRRLRLHDSPPSQPSLTRPRANLSIPKCVILLLVLSLTFVD